LLSEACRRSSRRLSSAPSSADTTTAALGGVRCAWANRCSSACQHHARPTPAVSSGERAVHTRSCHNDPTLSLSLSLSPFLALSRRRCRMPPRSPSPLPAPQRLSRSPAPDECPPPSTEASRPAPRPRPPAAPRTRGPSSPSAPTIDTISGSQPTSRSPSSADHGVASCCYLSRRGRAARCTCKSSAVMAMPPSWRVGLSASTFGRPSAASAACLAQ
jgi:hypothetical protein